MPTLRVDVWSDVVCPWCYIGKRRLESALAQVEARGTVDVVWHSFELDPAAPRQAAEDVPYAERLARKYGCSAAEAEAMIARVTRVAAGDGLTMRFDRARPGNTFDAHRLLHLAAEVGLQDAVKERFFRGYMTEGIAIADPEALVRMASEAGIDEARARAVVESDRYGEAVREDERLAAQLGVRGVPFFVFGGRYAVSGAQPADVIADALARAWDDAAAPTDAPEGDACGPEGCDAAPRDVDPRRAHPSAQ